MSHIIVVNDDLLSGALLAEMLKKNAYQVTLINSMDSVLDYLYQQDADLVILDLSQSPQQVITLVTAIYESFAIPLLLLTPLSEPLNVSEVLKAGADQYLMKPYCNKALLLHIYVLLRRIVSEKQRLAFQYCTPQFSLKIARLPLTETEMLLMKYLGDNEGHTISKAILQKEVLKKEISAFDRNLDVHISNIRRKMLKVGLSKLHLKTVHGRGYAFCEKLSHFCFLFCCYL
ncbi:MAG: response regulator transcription factor [Psychromonas sp.]